MPDKLMSSIAELSEFKNGFGREGLEHVETDGIMMVSQVGGMPHLQLCNILGFIVIGGRPRIHSEMFASETLVFLFSPQVSAKRAVDMVQIPYLKSTHTRLNLSTEDSFKSFRI